MSKTLTKQTLREYEISKRTIEGRNFHKQAEIIKDWNVSPNVLITSRSNARVITEFLNRSA